MILRFQHIVAFTTSLDVRMLPRVISIEVVSSLLNLIPQRKMLSWQFLLAACHSVLSVFSVLRAGFVLR
jgi:hypothetical protein